MKKPQIAVITIGLAVTGLFHVPAKAANLDTPQQLLQYASGSNTTTSTSEIDLSTASIPSLANKEWVEVNMTLRFDNTSSFFRLRNNTNSTAISTLPNDGSPSANTTYIINCQIHPNVQNTTTVINKCNEQKVGGTAVNFISSETTTTTNSAWTLSLRWNPGSSSSRTAIWKWEVLIHKVTGTTSVTEEDNQCHLSVGTGLSLSTCTITNSLPEDGLSHIRFQEEGSDVIANPDVLNFVGSCITLSNPTTTITGLLTSTCGTGDGGGGGFGLIPGGISTAHAQELEATLNEDGDVLSLGLTDNGWNIVNEFFGVILVLLSIVAFLIAFFIGKSLIKRR